MTPRSARMIAAVAVTALSAACVDSATTLPTELQPAFSGSANSGGAGGGGAGGGGGATSTGGGGGGGGSTKTTCTNTLSLNAAASEALTGNTFSTTYVLNSCQSKTRVSMTATDVATGAVVWSSVPDLAGTIAIWTLPYRLTTYRIDARAVAGSTNALVATASTTVSTLDELPCSAAVHETATVGYYGIYPAVWAATDVQDCGKGGTVHLQIRNMNSGEVELDYPNLGPSTFIDFEGAMVSYNTPYRVYAELRSQSGEVLASSTTDLVSSPLR